MEKTIPFEEIGLLEGVFILWMIEELKSSRKKFPSPDCSMAALTEEAGELAQALLAARNSFTSESWKQVFMEAVQTANMALRVACEGDPTIVAKAPKGWAVPSSIWSVLK